MNVSGFEFCSDPFLEDYDAFDPFSSYEPYDVCKVGTGLQVGRIGGFDCAASIAIMLGGIYLPRSQEPDRCTEVNSQLPDSGPGFYTYGPDFHRYGQPGVIDLLLQTAAAWIEDHPGLEIGYGDISLLYGGAFTGHNGHRLGLEVDVRPLRTDAANAIVFITDPEYDRDATNALIQFFLDFNSGLIRTIIFGDSSIAGVNLDTSGVHNNHFHGSFFSGVNCR
ncbi:MAG: penicillin-insensitive murein endopeptidase [Acidobacteria bacterium]|nr:penicillin-insensitive murein endopeptidase [Acidobacteriota bacterium]